ncbi:TPA: hypothetical protein ACQJIZ_004860, partial [Citrobacter freundii]
VFAELSEIPCHSRFKGEMIINHIFVFVYYTITLLKTPLKISRKLSFTIYEECQRIFQCQHTNNARYVLMRK